MAKKKKEHQTFDRMADLRPRKSKRALFFGNGHHKKRRDTVFPFPVRSSPQHHAKDLTSLHHRTPRNAKPEN
jgi:hypothetical protein